MFSAGDDWAIPETFNKIYRKWSERRQAVGGGAVSESAAAGQIATYYSTIANLQQNILDLAVQYCKTLDNPDNYWSDYGDFRRTYEQIYADAGITGFTRHVTNPSDIVTTGKAQRGDIMGEWILNDIHKILDTCVISFHQQYTWIDRDMNGTFHHYSGDATTAANAFNQWWGKDFTPLPDWTRVLSSWSFGWSQMFGYDGTRRAWQATPKVVNIWTGRSHSLDGFWLYPSKGYNTTFADYSGGLGLSENVWKKYYSAGGSTDAEITCPRVGTSALVMPQIDTNAGEQYEEHPPMGYSIGHPAGGKYVCVGLKWTFNE